MGSMPGSTVYKIFAKFWDHIFNQLFIYWIGNLDWAELNLEQQSQAELNPDSQLEMKFLTSF